MTATCACLDTDARACYDLRYFGRTPVVRGSDSSHSEAAWLRVSDDDDECACPCHDEAEEEDD